MERYNEAILTISISHEFVSQSLLVCSNEIREKSQHKKGRDFGTRTKLVEEKCKSGEHLDKYHQRDNHTLGFFIPIEKYIIKKEVKDVYMTI